MIIDGGKGQLGAVLKVHKQLNINIPTTCANNQYWNGTACVDSPSASCASGQYWNGTACVTGSISLQDQLAQIAAILRKLFDLSNLLR